MSERVYQELLARVGEASPAPRLEPSARLMDLLGNPQDSAPVVHLTGTNGKTSTARMIDALLREQGMRTGLLTSPHLERFNERICIDGAPISNEALESNWADIRPFVELVDAQLTEAGEVPLTFFEVLTALAFASFADAPVDIMVIEVGMGGSWDSTNVVTADVAVFTPIGLDHLGRIGNSIEEIAATKAGIIKPGSIVVSAEQTPTVTEILRQAALRLGATFYLAPLDFAASNVRVAVGGQLIDVRGRAANYPELFLGLFGAHQAQNAALAIAAVESLIGDASIPLDPDRLSAGLAGASSPGRLEVVGVSPSVIIDGAHNPHGAAALAATVRESFGFAELGLVVAVLADKDARGILDALRPLSSRIWVTNSPSERSMPAEELAVLAAAAGFDVSLMANPAEAAAAAREWAGNEPDRGVLVTGSITLAGFVRAEASSYGWLRP